MECDGNGDVKYGGNGDVKYGGERLTWNVLDNVDVECSRERLREIWWVTLMWNAPENSYVKYGGER